MHHNYMKGCTEVAGVRKDSPRVGPESQHKQRERKNQPDEKPDTRIQGRQEHEVVLIANETLQTGSKDCRKVP